MAARSESLRGTGAVAQENARPGDEGWWGWKGSADAIEGFAWPVGVRPGERLGLHVSAAPAARWRARIFRLGWYDGVGAREVGVLPASGDLAALAQAAPPPDPGTGWVATGWPQSASLVVPEDWVSGVYVAVLQLTTGPHAGVQTGVRFVVRQALGAPPADLLVQQPTNTAQAYNHWGGKSLYESNSSEGIPAVKVSYLRPYPPLKEANLNARWPFAYDVPLLRYLEREGVDVAYTTNVDTHREPWSLLTHRAVMTSGHDEYWTREMRDGFEDARDAGVHLACMGANTCYWQIRHEDDLATIVEYRHASRDPVVDRSTLSIKFRDLEPPRPECRLLGVQYQEGLAPQSERRDYVVTEEAAGHPWLEGTGLTPGDVFGGLVGYEWDGLQEGDIVPGTTALLHCEDEIANADVTHYTAPSGAHVFAAGSLQFAWGLDGWGHDRTPHPGLQRLVRNGLDAMGVGRMGDGR